MLYYVFGCFQLALVWTYMVYTYLDKKMDVLEISLPNDVFIHMGVSKNRGTPKSSIFIRFSIINHPFWGTPIFGNIHIYYPACCAGKTETKQQVSSSFWSLWVAFSKIDSPHVFSIATGVLNVQNGGTSLPPFLVG